MEQKDIAKLTAEEIWPIIERQGRGITKTELGSCYDYARSSFLILQETKQRTSKTSVHSDAPFHPVNVSDNTRIGDSTWKTLKNYAMKENYKEQGWWVSKVHIHLLTIN